MHGHTPRVRVRRCVNLPSRPEGAHGVKCATAEGGDDVYHPFVTSNGYIEMHIALQKGNMFFRYILMAGPRREGGNPCPNFCLNISKYMLPHKNGGMLF